MTDLYDRDAILPDINETNFSIQTYFSIKKILIAADNVH